MTKEKNILLKDKKKITTNLTKKPLVGGKPIIDIILIIKNEFIKKLKPTSLI